MDLRRPNLRTIWTVYVACVLVGVVIASTDVAHASQIPGSDGLTAVERGQVLKDLEPATSGACDGVLETDAGLCTHGPDLSPRYVDVTAERSTGDLRADASRDPGLVPVTPGSTVGTTNPPTDGSGAVVCEDTGTEGKRIQVLYLVASDQTDRFASLAETLGTHVLRADGQLNASAAQTGGNRHFRFVTDPSPTGCTLDFKKVVVSAGADDSFNASVSAVKAQGYNRSDRKYLMFTDANVYCGIGSVYLDDSSAQNNDNNGYSAEYARVDNGCWGFAEAHELMHNLGAVQPSAPNSTENLHCTDDADEMCYDDDGSGPVVMRQICPSQNEIYFDCNHDDYFNTAPAPGSYLDGHWNAADSAFLITTIPGSGPEPDTTPPAAPTGLRATTPSRGHVNLTWQASSAPDLEGYRVFRNGSQIAELGKVTSFADSGLADLRLYTYTVRAFDYAGNSSGNSAAATILTLPFPTPPVGPDPDPPVTSTPPVSTIAVTELFGRTIGSFGRYSVTRESAPGPSTAKVTATRRNSRGRRVVVTARIVVRNPAGRTVASRRGKNPSVKYRLPTSGRYSWRVEAAAGTRVSLSLRRVTTTSALRRK